MGLQNQRSPKVVALAVFLGFNVLQSVAQQYAYRSPAGAPPAVPVIANPGSVIANSGPVEDTNSTTRSTIQDAIQPPSELPSAQTPFKLEPGNKNELLPIIANVGAKRAADSLTSVRVFGEDSLLYMNRDPSVLRNPVDLANSRGENFFGRTAVESLGDYLDANYHHIRVVSFVRETFLDNPFDRRIVSPLSPAGAGEPGAALTRPDDIHYGLRNVLSSNPRAFVTYRDKAEFDAAVDGPSFVLRNPIYFDKDKALITALAVEYPDWQVNDWDIPRFGATIAYVHRNHSLNLTASAGRNNFELTKGRIESRYEERIMLYAQVVF